jgi:hypothetical protein
MLVWWFRCFVGYWLGIGIGVGAEEGVVIGIEIGVYLIKLRNEVKIG